MEKIRLGCVGLNRGLSLLTDVAADERVDICAVCDASHDRLKAAAAKLEQLGHCPKQYSSYHDLLASDARAIIIATDIASHIPMTVAALDAGKHVLSEIPAISDANEALKLRAAVSDHPRQKYMIAENCCYWDFIGKYKRLYDSGELGGVWYMEAEYLHNVTALMKNADGSPTWRASLDAVKYLTHDLGPLLYITGDRCVSVCAFAPAVDSTGGVSAAHPDEVAIFRTEKGALIKIFISFGLVRDFRHNFALYGTGGTVERDRKEPYSHIWTREGYRRLDTDESASGFAASAHGGADGRMLHAFIDCVANDTQPPLGVDFACDISLPGIAAAKSAAAGGISVDIPDLSSGADKC